MWRDNRISLSLSKMVLFKTFLNSKNCKDIHLELSKYEIQPSRVWSICWQRVSHLQGLQTVVCMQRTQNPTCCGAVCHLNVVLSQVSGQAALQQQALLKAWFGLLWLRWSRDILIGGKTIKKSTLFQVPCAEAAGGCPSTLMLLRSAWTHFSRFMRGANQD